MTNRLINLAVTTSTFGAELITADNSAAARSLLGVTSGGGSGEVASVNGQVGAVVLDYEDVGAASAAQGAKADTALQPGDAVGAISSVNGKTGTVILNADDVGAATAAQGAKADTALQPGDIPAQAVTSVNGKTGAINLVPADLGAATSSQGAKADTAVQPGQLSSVATSGSYNSLTNLPTLGTAASQSAAAFATATQGSKADTALQPSTLETLTLSSGYAALGSGYQAPCRKTVDNVIRLFGVVSGTFPSTGGGFVTVCTLPAGSRPAASHIFVCQSNQGPVRVDVLASGAVNVTGSTATAPTWVSLGAICFPGS